ncbi:MAG: glycosyltransferase, partial [Acetobacteraceae bacterium]|nr:glycosyltransferase [Acetobacteraceae bacterium]
MIADVAALLLAALPLALTLANLAFYRTPERASGRPSLSVLVPARNEERNIGALAACVLASEGVDLELLVLDDHSTDRTGAILAAIADARLRVIAAPSLPAGWSGKQHACAALAREARHTLMVFVDADVRLAPDALVRIAGFMERNDVGLASGFPRQVVRSWSERLLLPLIHFLLLGYLPMWVMRRSPSPGLGAGCGQLFVARRTDYARAGGHAAIRASLHD